MSNKLMPAGGAIVASQREKEVVVSVTDALTSKQATVQQSREEASEAPEAPGTEGWQQTVCLLSEVCVGYENG